MPVGGLSGATPNATQLIEELRWALEENRREVERLTTERDEARREVCNNEANHLPTMADPRREAKKRGWDCYKENKENTND